MSGWIIYEKFDPPGLPGEIVSKFIFMGRAGAEQAMKYYQDRWPKRNYVLFYVEEENGS